MLINPQILKFSLSLYSIFKPFFQLPLPMKPIKWLPIRWFWTQQRQILKDVYRKKVTIWWPFFLCNFYIFVKIQHSLLTNADSVPASVTKRLLYSFKVTVQDSTKLCFQREIRQFIFVLSLFYHPIKTDQVCFVWQSSFHRMKLVEWQN